MNFLPLIIISPSLFQNPSFPKGKVGVAGFNRYLKIVSQPAQQYDVNITGTKEQNRIELQVFEFFVWIIAIKDLFYAIVISEDDKGKKEYGAVLQNGH